MGQYFVLYNKTKNKKINHDFEVIGGMKLTEHSYINNPLAVFLRKKLATDWKGDVIYHIGDYASPEDGTQTACKMWDEADIILNNAKGIKCRNYSDEKEIVKYPYVFNNDKKQYIDIRNATVCDHWAEKENIWLFYYDPLLLLTACGNGQGGGDYYGTNQEYIGSWAGDSLGASNEIPEGYEEVNLEFLNKREMCDLELSEGVTYNLETHGIEGLGYQKWYDTYLPKVKVD